MPGNACVTPRYLIILAPKLRRSEKMENQDVFTVADFAEFTRTTRDTLLHYEKIGLLFPESRGENNYRFYSSGQLAVVNLIRTCQALGMKLAEIKGLAVSRTPELIDALLKRQLERIDEKIEEWLRARKLLFALKKTIHSTFSIDEDAVSVQFMPAEAIILGDLNDYSRGRTDYDALLDFYRSCSKKCPELDMNYPVWGMFSEDRVKQGDFMWPDRYYFSNPEGFDEKNASLYAIGYARGGYGKNRGIYERMFDYISDNGFEVCGPAYEEYPLNEVCITDNNNYLMRVMITVRELRK